MKLAPSKSPTKCNNLEVQEIKEEWATISSLAMKMYKFTPYVERG